MPFGSPAAIADAVVTLLTNRNLAEKMGRAARRKAIEDFDEERVFSMVKAVYADLLARKCPARAPMSFGTDASPLHTR